MAINPIQLPQRAPRKDTGDKILQGLQIAEAVFKIPVSYQQYRAYQAEAGMKEDERAGITTRAKLGQGGMTVIPEEPSSLTPSRYGAPLMRLKVRDGDEVKEIGVVNDETNRKFFSDEKALRDEYQGHRLTKETDAALASARGALEVLKRNEGKAAGTDDIAAVYKFYHTIESQSAVKGDEFNAAAGAAGLFERLKSLDDKLKTGAFLGPKGRDAMRQTIGSIIDAQLSVQDVLDDKYTELALDRKFKPKNVVTGFWAQPDSPIRPLTKPEGVDEADWNALSHVNKRKLIQKLGAKK